jgi:hypothetical protein
MGFEFWPAVLAGLCGGIVMSILMGLMRVAGKTEMNMMYMQGTMMTAKRGPAMAIGAITHLVVLSGVVIGSVYALLFSWLEISSGNAWWVGAILGVVHGVLGGLAMTMMPAIHPRMGTTGAGGGITLKSPGPFGRNYGRATPPGLLMTHILYGLVLGGVYGMLVA